MAKAVMVLGPRYYNIQEKEHVGSPDRVGEYSFREGFLGEVTLNCMTMRSYAWWRVEDI